MQRKSTPISVTSNNQSSVFQELRHIALCGICLEFGIYISEIDSEVVIDINVRVPDRDTGRKRTVGNRESIVISQISEAGQPTKWVRDCLVRYLTHEANEAVLLKEFGYLTHISLLASNLPTPPP